MYLQHNTISRDLCAGCAGGGMRLDIHTNAVDKWKIFNWLFRERFDGLEGIAESYLIYKLGDLGGFIGVYGFSYRQTFCRMGAKKDTHGYSMVVRKDVKPEG